MSKSIRAAPNPLTLTAICGYRKCGLKQKESVRENTRYSAEGDRTQHVSAESMMLARNQLVAPCRRSNSAISSCSTSNGELKWCLAISSLGINVHAL